MNLGVLGEKAPLRNSRPSSAKPRNNINPITGEDVTEYASRQPRSVRPEAVPSLDLGVFSDHEEKRKPVGQYSYRRLDTPGTASTVSWGTPHGSARSCVSVYSEQNSARPVSQRPQNVPHLLIGNKNQNAVKKARQPSAWDADPVPSNLCGPSPQQQERYKEYQEELKRAYQAKQNPYSEQDVDKDIAELKSILTAVGQEESDLYSKQWTTDSNMDHQLRRRLDAEAMTEEKRKHELIETVMVDQLSRPPISDLEQDAERCVSRCHEPGMPRGVIRTLHETKIKTSASTTENLLSKRVRFGARILTRNGRDAIRELMGFFFMLDNTFTIYEYRQFGKRLPDLRDKLSIRPRMDDREQRSFPEGASIVVSTRAQPTLPASVSLKPNVTFIITDLDQEAKERELLHGTRPSEMSQRKKELNVPGDTQQLKDYVALQKLQATVRAKIKRRGSRAFSSVGTYLRTVDTDHDGTLDVNEFRVAVKHCRLPIADENMVGVWRLLDVDGDGRLDYNELMRGVLGFMSEYRKRFVLKAFRKIDSKKEGVITHTDMRKFYCGNKNSTSAMETDGVELKEFLQSFDFCAVRGEVTYHEFEEYYEGISLLFDVDDDFLAVLRKTWGI